MYNHDLHLLEIYLLFFQEYLNLNIHLILKYLHELLNRQNLIYYYHLSKFQHFLLFEQVKLE